MTGFGDLNLKTPLVVATCISGFMSSLNFICSGELSMKSFITSGAWYFNLL